MEQGTIYSKIVDQINQLAEIEAAIDVVQRELADVPEKHKAYLRVAYHVIDAQDILGRAIKDLEVKTKLEENKAVRITYTDSSGRVTDREIIPLYVETGKSGHQNLMAIDVEKGEPRKFIVSRIVAPSDAWDMLNLLDVEYRRA